jgi:tetratricopeptide (TPR) repeat protein
LAAFQQAVVLDDDLAVAQNNLGLSYMEGGQLSGAREALERAVTLNPESAAAWLNLGQTEHRAGRFEGAIRAYRAALRLNPHLTAAQVNLGLIDYEVGLFSESQHYLELALDAQPDMSQAKITLGAVALQLGDRERAWRALHSAVSDRADDPLLHFYLALWYEGAGLDEAAIHTFKTVLALQPHPDLAALARSHLRVLQSMGPAGRFPSAEAMKGE